MEISTALRLAVGYLLYKEENLGHRWSDYHGSGRTSHVESGTPLHGHTNLGLIHKVSKMHVRSTRQIVSRG